MQPLEHMSQGTYYCAPIYRATIEDMEEAEGVESAGPENRGIDDDGA